MNPEHFDPEASLKEFGVCLVATASIKIIYYYTA